jgi:Fe-S-cluster-containing dehydrogenase component
MDQGRRRFLKYAGITAAAVVGERVLPKMHGASEASEVAPAAPSVRWAMVIDPVRCLKDKGCTACVDACRKAHNVPVIPERRHEIKWIWKEPFAESFVDQDAEYVDQALTEEPVVVLCNHCDNPPCVRVCPTQATWRRPDGIVMMDWHRCIGCRYCMAGCPYGSRSFNWEDPRPFIKDPNPDFPTRTKGVVEKCTFCAERIDVGQPPACVAACKEKAMTFGNLADPNSEVRAVLRTRYALRRKPGLGTRPAVYYLV